MPRLGTFVGYLLGIRQLVEIAACLTDVMWIMLSISIFRQSLMNCLTEESRCTKMGASNTGTRGGGSFG
jgi:hypothetical protein